MTLEGSLTCDYDGCLEVAEDVYAWRGENFCHDCYRHILGWGTDRKTKDGLDIIEVCSLQIKLKYMELGNPSPSLNKKEIPREM